jgi:hypothetical protein
MEAAFRKKLEAKKNRNNWKTEDVAGGWRYAPSFDSFKDPKYIAQPHLYAGQFDLVRRRKFSRIARPITETTDVAVTQILYDDDADCVSDTTRDVTPRYSFNIGEDDFDADEW